MIKLDMAGVELPLLFGLPALRRIVEKTSINEFTDSISLTFFNIRDILFSGYLNHCKAEDIDPKISAKDIYDYLETNLYNEVEFQKIADAVNAFNTSKYLKPTNGKASDEEKKSLSTSTK
jgi:hypothetical protein